MTFNQKIYRDWGIRCALMGVLIMVLSTVAYAQEPSVTTTKASEKNTDQLEVKEQELLQALMVTMSVLGKGADGGRLGGVDLKKLPIAAMVVNREELDRLKFVDPDEFLDRIPGESQVRNLRIPKGGKSYTVPLVDGLPLGSPYRGATQDISDVNAFDIERIEILKGPASALYPSNAFGGTINVVTRTPEEKPTWNVWSEGGRFERARAGVNGSGSIGAFGYFLDANLQQTEGLRESFVNDRDQFSAKGLYQVSPQTTLMLRGEFIDRTEQFPGDLTQAEFDEDPTQLGRRAGSKENLDSVLGAFKLEHQFLFDADLSLGLVHRRERAEGVGRFRGPNKTELGDSALKLLYTQRFDFLDAIWSIGADRFQGQADYIGFDSANFDDPGNTVNTSTDGDLTIQAFYSQVMIQPANKWTVSLGLRHEDVALESFNRLNQNQLEKSFSSADPKFGVVYQWNPQLSTWLGLSTGFLTPDLGELFTDRNANPNLRPENANHSELGFRGNYGTFRFDISGYITQIEDFIVAEEVYDAQGHGFLHYTNAGEVDISGIETVVEYQANSWLSFGASHAFTRNRYITFFNTRTGQDLSGNRLSRSPDHHLNLRSGIVPTKNLTLELEWDSYSGYATNDDNDLDPLGTFTRGERLNLRLGYVYGGWRFWLHGLNLTDTLEDRVGFSRGRRTFRLINGREVYAGLSYRLGGSHD